MEVQPRPLAAPKMLYQPGDECWISIEESKPLVRCTIVLSFQSPWHPTKHYVCQVMDDEQQTFKVRDALLMSETAEGPLPIWRKLA